MTFSFTLHFLSQTVTNDTRRNPRLVRMEKYCTNLLISSISKLSVWDSLSSFLFMSETKHPFIVELWFLTQTVLFHWILRPCMGLLFWFVMKTALITEGCFSYYWAMLSQHQGLFCFPLHHHWVKWSEQEIERGHIRDSSPQLAKKVFNSIWHHAQLEEDGRRKGNIQS